MFHFWFNTFFVAVDHEKHTVMLKSPSDGHSRMPRSATTTSASTKLHSTMPYVKAVPLTGSSSTIQRVGGRIDGRATDRVVKAAVAHTVSSGSSDTNGSVIRRRPGQLRDQASARPHSIHSGSPTGTETLSFTGLKASQTSRSPRDKLQTSSGSASAAARSKALRDQEPKKGPHAAAVPVSGHPKTASQDRKTAGRKVSVPTVQRGNPGSSGGVGLAGSVSQSDSAKASPAKGETARTTPRHNGALHPSASNGGSQKLTKEHVATHETTSQRAKLPAAAGCMQPASSTPDLSKTTRNKTSRFSPRQPTSTTKAGLSGVPRYIQRDLASRHAQTTKTPVTPQHTAVSRQMPDFPVSRQTSDHAVIKKSGSNSSLVSSSVQARSEGLPSDPVSLTRYTPHNSRQCTSPGLTSGRQSSAATAQASAVFEVSGSSCRPTTFCTLTLTKSEIDKANKDVQHKVYSSDFKVSAIFC